MFEIPRNKENVDAIIHNIEVRSEEYLNTLIFLKEGQYGKKNIVLLPEDMRKRVRVMCNPTIPIIKIKQIDRAISFMYKIIKKYKPRNKMIIFSKRASLFSAILFAYQSGYKDIVLCGIDLNNTKYFYVPKEKELIEKGRLPITSQNVKILVEEEGKSYKSIIHYQLYT